MKTLRNKAAIDEIAVRLSGLDANEQARWGRFNCTQMLAHCADGLRMALGDLKVQGKKVPLRYWPIKQLIIHWLPFPKGAPTAPELLARGAQSIDDERRAINQLMARFAERKGQTPWPEHPAFGQLDENSWGVLLYQHIDHHLKQFGH